MEYGTGVFNDGPFPGKGSHHPAGHHLEEWAMRHGGHEKWGANPGRAVAKIIGDRGGLKSRKFLRNAVDMLRPKIAQNLAHAGVEIKKNWGR